MTSDKKQGIRTGATEPPREEQRKDKGGASSSPISTVNKQQGAPDREIGGRGGLDPARYGDWEKKGRCIDF